MPVNRIAYQELSRVFFAAGASLVAVSKFKSPEEIQEMYDLGQRDFGENYVQELCEKQNRLPGDIRWHFIGHLQSNKVKYIGSFVHLIQGVDSFKLLKEINRQGARMERTIHCLLQVHIAEEENKFGFDEAELEEILGNPELPRLDNILISGLMGMASFSQDMEKVRQEFRFLKSIFDRYSQVSMPNCRFTILSMGMSADYQVALEEGGNMVRIGSILFGPRTIKS